MSNKSYDNNIPKHIAIIPDGNRRWAKSKGLPAWEGHRKAAKNFNELLDWCKEFGVKELSFWGMSTENLGRDKKEVDVLFEILDRFCDDATKDLSGKKKDEDVIIRFIGNFEKLPEKTVKKMNQLMEMTKNNSKYKLNFLIGYGGRWEITQAAKKIAEKVKEGKLKTKEITQETFQKHLMLEDEPDLIIRTSEERLSGLLPWQSIYSEIIFIKDKHWPEFTQEDFRKCLEEYASRQRRFGK